MSKHTPTPWSEGIRGPNNCPVIGARGLMVAMLTTGVGFQDEADANAAFIVKAVNSHDMLVAALRKIAGGAHLAASDEVDAEGWLMELADIEREAREALAAAGEGHE